MISVLLCTYNQEKYIGKTLDGILNQECCYPFVLYVNDDCSTDKTWDVISKYSIKYPDIIDAKLNEQNLGIPNNFYDVLNRCKGEYVCLCGGDDIWCDNKKLQKQIEILESNNDVGLVYSDYRICDENDCLLEEIKTRFVSYEDLLKNNTICASTICVRKSLYDAFISDVDPVQKKWKMEDYPLLLWVSQHSRLYHLNIVTTTYRIVDSSITHSGNIKKRLLFEDTLYSIRSFFNDRKQVIGNEGLIRIRDLNKAHLCLVYGDYETYKIIVNQLSILHLKSLVYRLIGINRSVFCYARMHRS